MNDLGEILHCVSLLVKGHGNESGEKKAISNVTVYLVFLLQLYCLFSSSFNFTFQFQLKTVCNISGSLHFVHHCHCNGTRSFNQEIWW